MDQAKNFAKGTVSQGYDDTATSIVLAAGDGARFPAAPFNAVWWNATDYPDPADDPSVEIVRVTAKSTDTLTVERGHEGTGSPGVAGFEHQLEGKAYRMIAPLTAKVINSEMLSVVRVGDTYDVDVGDTFNLAAVNGFRLDAQNAGLALQSGATFMEFGDVDENNTGVKVKADDNLGQVTLIGQIGTNQAQTASTGVGAIAKKIEVFDAAGVSLGFIPVYASIT